MNTININGIEYIEKDEFMELHCQAKKIYREMILKANFILSNDQYIHDYVDFLYQYENDEEIDCSKEIEEDIAVYTDATIATHQEIMNELGVSLPPAI